MNIKVALWAFLTIASLVAIFILGTGVGQEQERARKPTPYEQMRFDSEKQSRENCLKAGGSVIESAWDLRMKDCKTPAAKEGR